MAIRRRALQVLGEVASSPGVVGARRRALGRVDPVLRPWVEARVRARLADATLTTVAANDEAHVARLAYLDLARVGVDGADDVEAVKAAFEARWGEARTPRALGWLGFAWIGALVFAITGAGALASWWRARPVASIDHQGPPSSGAFVRGGAPPDGGEGASRVFSEALMEASIAIDRVRAARSAGGRGEGALEGLRADAASKCGAAVAAARASIGAAVADAMNAMLLGALALVDRAAPSKEDIAEWTATVRDLDASIAATGLGYYVDSDVMVDLRTGAAQVFLSAFSVRRVRVFRSEAETVRVLRLRRLDTLNFSRSLLGMTREDIVDALVLLDRIEEDSVVNHVPALVEGGRARLVDPETRGPWVEVVERAAAASMRREALALGAEPAQVASLAAALARRRDAFEAWSERLSSRGVFLRPPTTLRFTSDSYASLQGVLLPTEWRSLVDLSREVTDEPTLATFQVVNEALIESVERHEAQHRLDFARGPFTSMPQGLEAYVGPLIEEEERPSISRRALSEASAYLSEIARGERLVRTQLSHLAQMLFDRRTWGMAETYAALAIFEGLAAELGLGQAPLAGGGEIRREAFATIFVALIQEPSAELCDAAKRIWSRWFSRPLPPLTPREAH